MITTKKAKILDRTFFVTVECPFCHKDTVWELNFYMGSEYAIAECDHCEEQFKIDMFEYLSQHN